ncbi:MAG TPA: chemotaxis protein CheW [Ohtaekwangia sp.]|uniref:chemotaxis protein CheW n=1 Tax=Ohtaekwangia sp. TaxID=2066019 RepID=UPI002F94AD77
MSKTTNTSETVTDQGRLQQIVVFKLGQEEYGLTIDQIREVVITPTITRLPQTPLYIKGVSNIRGNVIAILNLEEKFQLTKSAESITRADKTFTLVIESDEYKMGILVYEVPNTLSISSASIENSVFMNDHQSEQSYITGIVKLDKRLIVMIDIFKVIQDKDTQKVLAGQQI